MQNNIKQKIEKVAKLAGVIEEMLPEVAENGYQHDGIREITNLIEAAIAVHLPNVNVKINYEKVSFSS